MWLLSVEFGKIYGSYKKPKYKANKLCLQIVDKAVRNGYYNNIMKVNETFADIKILSPEASLENGCAVAVGSFDGVHLGHRSLIKKLVAEAKNRGVPAVVFTFSAEDSPKNGVLLLAQEDKKERLLASLGVDAVVSAPFSAVREMSAERFARGFLFEELGAKCVVCGYDFRFGADRAGDATLIKSLLSPNGVAVYACPSLDIGGKPISSTDIRALIAEGRVEEANALLGREFSFSSEIVHGASLGRTLGFPTLNQNYPSRLAPLRFGVYATLAELKGVLYRGVTNFGIKPTVQNGALPISETYLFDYSGDCYGEIAEIRFKSFIRGEKRFSSLEELKAQVELDKLSALNRLTKE